MRDPGRKGGVKEILAIIRPGKDRETKIALAKIGCLAMTTVRVRGRGKQRGLRYSALTSDVPVPQFVLMKYLPKKMIYLVVNDPMVRPAVQCIVRINQTGQHGDGKVFVMGAKQVHRIRTGEKGDVAVR